MIDDFPFFLGIGGGGGAGSFGEGDEEFADGAPGGGTVGGGGHAAGGGVFVWLEGGALGSPVAVGFECCVERGEGGEGGMFFLCGGLVFGMFGEGEGDVTCSSTICLKLSGSDES